MKKIIIFSILFSLLSIPLAFSETVSPDNVFVANDQFSSDFHTKLNRDITQLTNGVNNVRGVKAATLQTAGQIGAGTIGLENLADEAHPGLYMGEAFTEFVDDGLQPATSGSLTSNISAGTAYPATDSSGALVRVDKTSATSHTYTASKDTYVDISTAGDFTYNEVALGAAAPTVATNSVRLAKVSTDASTITTVTDLRVTSLITENQSALRSGLRMSYTSGDQVAVALGFARASGGTSNNYVMETTASKTLDLDDSGALGLDTGSKATSTYYHVYIVGSSTNAVSPSFVFSTSASAPTYPNNYDISRRIGTVYNTATNQIASFDQVTNSKFVYRQPIISLDDGAATTSTSFTPIVPTTATSALLVARGETGATKGFQISPVSIDMTSGGGGDMLAPCQGHFVGFAGNTVSGLECPITTSQTLYYDQTNASNMDIFTSGFVDYSLE